MPLSTAPLFKKDVSMKRWAIVCSLVLATVAMAQTTPKPLRTLYVSPRGSDANDGASLTRAFKTISAASKNVKPGDLVIVKGGTYFEHVHLMTPGTKEHPITFRAASGETALVTFGKRPTGWRKVKGTRFTYVAPHATIPNYVFDERHLTRYAEVRNAQTLDAMPGSFMVDEKKQTLNVHPLRGMTPDEAVIVTIDYAGASGAGAPAGKRGYAYDKGLWPRTPYNHVEGFMIAFQPIGIQIRADNCVARNNTVYGCAYGGVTIYKGKDSLIADNTTYRNGNYGVHVSTYAVNATLRGNLCRNNQPSGPFRYPPTGGHPYNLALYGSVQAPTVVDNLVISDQRFRVMRFKSGKGKIVTRGNVLVGGRGNVNWGKGSLFANNTVVGGNLKSRVDRYLVITPEAGATRDATVRDNLYLEKPDQIAKAAFADPVRHDYRLRADSPNLGKGAHPDAASVRYVSPKGDDKRDGRTPATAWRTLTKAAKDVVTGETVYVMAGLYRESIALSRKGVAFKTYGRGDVILQGRGGRSVGMSLASAKTVIVDGFIFKDFGTGIVITDSAEVEIVDNVFHNTTNGVTAKSSRNVDLVNNTFYRKGRGVDARKISGRLILRNNLFVDLTRAPVTLDKATADIVISERNAFSGLRAKAQLAAWCKRVYEGHPSILTKVKFPASGYLLPTGHPLGFAGLGHKPIGARGAAPDTSPIMIENVAAVYRSPTEAVVSWTTPRDYVNARVTLLGGAKPLVVRIDQFTFASMLKQPTLRARFADLKPGAKYTAHISLWTPGGRKAKAKVSFATPKRFRAPTTLYVATKGRDRNSGRKRNAPLKTLAAATFAAAPGDTILVAPGVYPETLKLWCGGLSSTKRLTVRSAIPGAAVISTGELRTNAVNLMKVKHVTLDGFRLRGSMYGAIRKIVEVNDCEGITISNCVFESPRSKRTGCILVGGGRVKGLTLRDNVFEMGFTNVLLWHSDNVTIDHNTFYRAGVSSVQLHGAIDARWRITNNIFMDVTAPQKINAAINLRRPSRNVVCDYNLYWKTKAAPNMGLFGVRSTRKGDPIPWGTQDAKTIEQAHKMFGLEKHGAWGDPLFVDSDKSDFRLKKGSPALKMAADGSNVGARTPPAAR
jgi:parallel beta-helix repeat protein